MYLEVNLSFDYYLSLGLDTRDKCKEDSMVPGQNRERHEGRSKVTVVTTRLHTVGGGVDKEEMGTTEYLTGRDPRDLLGFSN